MSLLYRSHSSSCAWCAVQRVLRHGAASCRVASSRECPSVRMCSTYGAARACARACKSAHAHRRLIWSRLCASSSRRALRMMRVGRGVAPRPTRRFGLAVTSSVRQVVPPKRSESISAEGSRGQPGPATLGGGSAEADKRAVRRLRSPDSSPSQANITQSQVARTHMA